MDNISSRTQRAVVEEFKHWAIDQQGVNSDDLPFSDLAVLRVLQDVRADLVNRYIKNPQQFRLSDQMVQTLSCVRLEEVDRVSECPCAPLSGYKWLRAIDPIPKMLSPISVTGILATDQNPRFTFLKWDRFQHKLRSRNPRERNGKYWTIREYQGSMYQPYFYNDSFLQVASISAIWEDPAAAEAYPKCGKVDYEIACNPLDVDFRTDKNLMTQIFQIAWGTRLQVRAGAGRDVLNDDQAGNEQIGMNVTE